MKKATRRELDQLKSLGLMRMGGTGSLLDWLFRNDIEGLNNKRPIDVLATKAGRAKVRAALLKVKIPDLSGKTEE